VSGQSSTVVLLTECNYSAETENKTGGACEPHTDSVVVGNLKARDHLETSAYISEWILNK